MKSIVMVLLLIVSCPVLAQLSSPLLSVSTSSSSLDLSWSEVSSASGYKLYYTAYPYTADQEIGEIDLGNESSVSIELWDGAAFLVAVQAYNSVESSALSNIEYFILDNNHLSYTSDKGSSNGLTLISPLGSTTTYLLDDSGEVKHQWESNYGPGLSVYLQESGNIIRTGSDNTGYFDEGGKGGYIEERDWDNNLLWQYHYSDESKSLHHDIEPLPNGNILALSWEEKEDIWTEVIIELEKEGSSSANIVWSWDLWDHLDELGLDSSTTNKDDWIHLNSIDYNQATDQIMVSSRNKNQVWIINKSDGSIAAISGIELSGQHDAKWIDDTDANSNITIYDNGTSNEFSRALEVDPTMQSIIWSYGNSSDEYFYSSRISGTQRLENGNTLICSGAESKILEVNSAGELIREYNNSYGSSSPRGSITEIFQAEKYPTGYTPYF